MAQKKAKTTKEIASMKMIKCPFCFETFKHSEVHFRINEFSVEVGTEESYNRALEDLQVRYGADEERLQKETDKLRIKRKFYRREDPRSVNFWQPFGGSQEEARDRNLPIIDFRDPEMYLAGSVEENAQEMVYSVKDIFGRRTNQRLCPYCHNPLPSSYGQNKVVFLSVIGVTSSGKTVYLSQLLKNIEYYMQFVGSSIPTKENVNAFIARYPISQGRELPTGTARAVFSPPLIIDIIRGGVPTTLVIYDIAGENCINPDRMQNYGPFIENSDGILMLIDPKQFPGIAGRLEEGAVEGDSEPTTVLRTIYESFLSGDLRDGERSPTPLAVTISKSDLLQELRVLPPDSHVFRAVTYGQERGFNRAAYLNLYGELGPFLRDNAPALLGLVGDLFRNHGFFAISSLGCGVRKNENDRWVPLMEPSPKRIEEPFFWLLSQLGLVGAITVQGRAEGVGGKLRAFLGW